MPPRLPSVVSAVDARGGLGRACSATVRRRTCSRSTTASDWQNGHWAQTADGSARGTTSNGSVVARKDWNVLATPASMALVVARTILGCWTGGLTDTHTAAGRRRSARHDPHSRRCGQGGPRVARSRTPALSRSESGREGSAPRNSSCGCSDCGLLEAGPLRRAHTAQGGGRGRVRTCDRSGVRGAGSAASSLYQRQQVSTRALQRSSTTLFNDSSHHEWLHTAPQRPGGSMPDLG
jgi:hypothetical protein